jgi:outer membrane protein TolC
MKSYISFAPGRPCRAAAVSVASVALTATALALSGCASYVDIGSDKQIAAPVQYETTQSMPNEGGAWPSFDWANQFGDPQLPKLIDEALAGNPLISQVHARLEKAQSYIESSRSALFPQVTGGYTWTRERYSPNGPTHVLSQACDRKNGYADSHKSVRVSGGRFV